MWLRRLVRPLIPDAVMARIRLAEHSVQARVNVEVVARGEDARRWLTTTPDTYRVRGDAEPVPASWPRLGDPSADLRVVPGVRASVVARPGPLRLRGRRRVEPELRGVQAVAWDPSVRDQVPWLGDDGDPWHVVDDLRAAGEPHALVPVPGPSGEPGRADPLPDTVVVLALVPLHDVGGGSRGAQLARALLRAGLHVVYVSVYGTQEQSDLGLRYLHPHLEQRSASEFDPAALVARAGSARVTVLLEAPHPSHLDHVRALRRARATVVYDLIDDWRASSLGGEWYRPDVETDVVGLSDHLVASAPDLVARLARDTGREVTLVPNAVDVAVFDPTATYEPPADLPAGEGPVLLYHGSLYGDWFDWDALAAVAGAHPGARVVVIGDVPARVPPLPGNVHLLGLKPHGDLPAHLAHADVGLVPFVVDEVTHAVSPLKAYEYLAMGLPVAAPPLRALEGLVGVVADADLPTAVAAALGQARSGAARAAAAAVRAEHSWEARVAALVDLVGCRPPGGGTPVVVLRRPVVHHARRARRVQG